MNVILFDTDASDHLLPLTATRPVGELRLGLLTLREKWERRLRASVSYITKEHLQEKYPLRFEEENLIVNGSIVPTDALCRRIDALAPSEALLHEGELVAARLSEAQFEQLIEDEEVHELQGIELEGDDLSFHTIKNLWDFIALNASEIVADVQFITSGRRSQPVSESNRIIGSQPVFLEENVRMECCTLNTTEGPIYIGRDAEVMEGAMLRGPLVIGDHTIVKMGAKIYGGTTIGPGCRVGGEISRCILLANSNKSHDGFLGDALLGEWCNLGADTNNSNLKNNYSEVKMWDYPEERFVKTGRQFLGLVMGDHAKCGINTMFNTGTVVGVFANVFGAGFPRNFIPDFAWGGADAGYRTYKFAEACETAATVMARRGQVFTDLDKAILYHIYDHTARFRNWEK